MVAAAASHEAFNEALGTRCAVVGGAGTRINRCTMIHARYS